MISIAHFYWEKQSMASSEEWSGFKLILRQAVVILGAIEKAIPGTPSKNLVTKNKIAQAKNNISESLNTKDFDQVSSELKYQELVAKLKEAEMPITDEELEQVRKL
ncbi:hypothetical protein [[Scytonema hofmanni] UTEX B 1581]|nr:hypothetical protein [[Scytonema hofmanni] UTEX B 1581]